jgi:hypothetical protein
MTRPRPHPVRVARGARGGRNARPGVTFLESVLGVVLLALVTASLASSVSFMQRSHARLERRLGAAELANRLILQFIDDRESLPSPSLPLEYGQHLFRWSMEEQRVRFVTRAPASTSTVSAGVGSGVSLDRVQMVIIRVWLAPESGGSMMYSPDIPGVVVTRLVDPLAFSNPDSLQSLLEQPDGIERLMNLFGEMDTGGGSQ